VITFGLFSLLAEYRANSRRLDKTISALSASEEYRETLVVVIAAQAAQIQALRDALKAQGIDPDIVAPPATTGPGASGATGPEGLAAPTPRTTVSTTLTTRPATVRPTGQPAVRPPSSTVPTRTVRRAVTSTTVAPGRTVTTTIRPSGTTASPPAVVTLPGCMVVNPLTGRCLIGR
jgi:hypothetical protein